jgi:hypothetical protein
MNTVHLDATLRTALSTVVRQIESALLPSECAASIHFSLLAAFFLR